MHSTTLLHLTKTVCVSGTFGQALEPMRKNFAHPRIVFLTNPHEQGHDARFTFTHQTRTIEHAHKQTAPGLSSATIHTVHHNPTHARAQPFQPSQRRFHMSTITTRTLDCRTPLIVEHIPGVRSAAMTWLIPAGTAHEPKGLQGLAAMHAELLGRGAGNFDSRAQADAYDRLGISRDYAPETFHIAFTATFMGDRISDALPLLVENVRDARMSEDSFAPARDLCLQTVQSLRDDPHERVLINARAAHAPEPINRSVYGTEEGLRALTPEIVAETWRDRAVPEGSIIALAGDVDADDAADLLNRLLADWTGAAPEIDVAPDPPRGYTHETHETNQVHIALVHDAPPEPDEHAFDERALTAVLSGGMSSRLFTEIREKRSLCYAVSARYGAEARYGRTLAYVGTTPDRAQESLDTLLGELRRINTTDGAVTKEEFDRAIIGMKSRLVMSGESTSARAAAIARDWRKLGRARSLDELTDHIDALSLDRLNEYLTSRRLGTMTACSIGPAPLEPPKLSEAQPAGA